MVSDERMLAQLAEAFVHLGASQSQARVMAAQLLKRARQQAEEQHVSEESALEQLLAKVAAGRRGDYTGQ